MPNNTAVDHFVSKSLKSILKNLSEIIQDDALKSEETKPFLKNIVLYYIYFKTTSAASFKNLTPLFELRNTLNKVHLRSGYRNKIEIIKGIPPLELGISIKDQFALELFTKEPKDISGYFRKENQTILISLCRFQTPISRLNAYLENFYMKPSLHSSSFSRLAAGPSLSSLHGTFSPFMPCGLDTMGILLDNEEDGEYSSSDEDSCEYSSDSESDEEDTDYSSSSESDEEDTDYSSSSESDDDVCRPGFSV